MKTRLALLVITVVYLCGLTFYHRWSEGAILNGGDPFGYYCYLPAIFIHHDLDDLRKSAYVRDSHRGVMRNSTQPVTDLEVNFADAKPIIKYTCGIAILELPAFLLAHLAAPLMDQPADGYSQIYLFAMHLWNTLFVLLGFCALSRFLRQFFSDGITALVLLSLAIGTNLLYFSIYNLGMSHGYLFTLYALLLLYTTKLYKTPITKNFIAVALCSGLITLVRPNEIFCLVIPLFYGFTTIYDWRKRIGAYLRMPGFYLAILVFVLCLLPQAIYWKTLTGHFLFYSYANERFDFLHPHIWEGLFGYANGWLAYSPVMLLALAGIPLLWYYRTGFLLPMLLFIPIHIYIIYSWWCWNYVNGLGSRPMIETYPLWAIPMGLLLTRACKHSWSKMAISAALALFVAMELLFTYRTGNNTLWSEDANKNFYYQTLFKTTITQQDMYVYDLDEPQPDNVHFVKRLIVNGWNDTTGNQNDSALVVDRDHSQLIGHSKAGEQGIVPGLFIRVAFHAVNLPPAASLYQGALAVVQYKRYGNSISYKQVRIQNKLPDAAPRGIWRFEDNAAGDVSFFTRVPPEIQPGDEFEVYAFTNGPGGVVLTNRAVELWQTDKAGQ